MISGIWLFAVGLASGILAVIGLLRWIWWLVLPRIRQQITGQLDEIHTAVTKNGGENNPATLPDKFERLERHLDRRFDEQDKRMDAIELLLTSESRRGDSEHQLIKNRLDALDGKGDH